MYKPALYTAANGLQRSDAHDITEEYAKEIGHMSGRCLDIGSGPGDVVNDFILPKLHPKATVLCSDISESMLNFGKSKYRDNKRLSFIKLDIESSDLPKDLIEHFDHVVSYNCLHWCQNMRKAFENIFTLLRPGGSTLLVFLANNPGFKAYETLAAMPRYQPYMKDVDRYIPLFQHTEQRRETLKSLVQDEGFEVLHYSRRERSYIFDTPETLTKFMLAVNPFIERMPVDLRSEYVKDLVAEAVKETIIFNKSNSNENKYSMLSRYYIFVLYLRKPIAK
ncbi:juvenile hormone acid O-methyltransferase-like [Neodiprion pinetum]|uniref:juvenile hormone acid O-methyltransferase-like n=1 Tax=Neodiprion pinetum TaxID=441929 RepID=UPI001EE0F160|nr:juvenile hormone acid O-methyltransferase-like [Neodiprion pinetum]